MITAIGIGHVREGHLHTDTLEVDNLEFLRFPLEIDDNEEHENTVLKTNRDTSDRVLVVS